MAEALQQGMTARQVSLLDRERARLFALLGRLLVAPPDAGLLDALRGLGGDATTIGTALGALATAARDTTPAAAGREFQALFIGVGRGEVLAFGSYYLTGFLHERPLAALRADLARLGIERAPGVVEPEDSLGFLCEAQAGLLTGGLGEPEEAADFFRVHIQPWAARCFADIESAASARFYRAVGALGRAVIEIETAAAALPE